MIVIVVTNSFSTARFDSLICLETQHTVARRACDLRCNLSVNLLAMPGHLCSLFSLVPFSSPFRPSHPLLPLPDSFSFSASTAAPTGRLMARLASSVRIVGRAGFVGLVWAVCCEVDVEATDRVGDVGL